MKRLIAATVVTAAAVAALAGCTVSTSQPLVFNADSCTKLAPSVENQIDGLKLDPSSKLADATGTCIWSDDTGRSVAIAVAGKGDGVGVQAGAQSKREKIAADKSLSIIDNETLSGDDKVLYTEAGSTADSSRTFTADADLDGKVTLTVDGVKVTDGDASAIFTALFTG
ncbi:hypothetical protein AX769_01785 [Frondihabitans sp. PAMC 28766]|uniref:hypothetical protein n=1 Tax=Frondihabitans sp. PAMC 28766 TaxID=1795630 RepID=UPI00078CA52A|nr:hypothetical protein [Frondihabitans sp. PAMC 28766]AMM19095.1 hypothetical protein AX769_01785 [Frondihabitans sp. PAMC 28766]